VHIKSVSYKTKSDKNTVKSDKNTVKSDKNTVKSDKNTVKNNEIFSNIKHIIKSNKIIEGSYKLTAIEQKIILFLVSLIKKDDDNFKIWRIKILELANFLNISKKNAYRELKEATYTMLDRKLKIQYEEGELQMNWLASAQYKDKLGIVELEISEKLKPFLLHLKRSFTKYNLYNVIFLKSSYSIRIYELLKQYERIGNRHLFLDNFKDKLGIVNKYKKYTDIKRRIILTAQKELEEKTDIKFTFEERKRGRKVDSIIFYIEKNIKEQEPLPPVKKSEYRISDEMDRLCLAIEEKLKLEPENKFKPKVFVFKNLKERKHPKAIVLALNRLNDYWDTAKESPWGYGQHVLDIESGNYHEQDTIAAHEALKKESLPAWFEADGF